MGDEFNQKVHDMTIMRLNEKIEEVNRNLHSRLDATNSYVVEECSRVSQRSDENDSVIKSDVVLNRQTLSSHAEKFAQNDAWRSSTEVEMRNLVKEISNLVKINTWMMTTTIVTLIGFVLWYIKQLGGI